MLISEVCTNASVFNVFARYPSFKKLKFYNTRQTNKNISVSLNNEIGIAAKFFLIGGTDCKMALSNPGPDANHNVLDARAALGTHCVSCIFYNAGQNPSPASMRNADDALRWVIKIK